MAAVTMMKRYRKVVAGLLALGMMLTAGAAQAGLLGVTAAKPDVTVDIMAWSEQGGVFAASGNTWFLQTNFGAYDVYGGYTLHANLLGGGHAVGHLDLFGEVVDGSGATLYSGLLLSGMVTNYGHAGTNFDFLFNVDPVGQLSSLYGARGGIILHTDQAHLNGDIVPAPVPEPATMTLLLSGCGALAALRRRSQQLA